jgi:hypothetical protein
VKQIAIAALLAAQTLAGAGEAQEAAVPEMGCVSESWSVAVIAFSDGQTARLRLDGVDVELTARLQKTFGDYGLSAVSSEANLVFNVILREDGREILARQPFGSELRDEIATCDPALRAAVIAAMEQ